MTFEYALTHSPLKVVRDRVPPIYLDNQATTPMDPRVVEIMRRSMVENYGNANNPAHVFGRSAAQILEEAKGDVGELLDADPADVLFTSGSTEAARLAIGIARAKIEGRPLRVAASAVEHKAVLEPILALEAQGDAIVTWIEVDGAARISASSLSGAMQQGVDLVCVMAANNEVGTIYPISEIAVAAHRAGAELLVDATQAAGRTELRAEAWGLDYLIVSAHKMYGPKGIGALIGPEVRSAIADRVVGHRGTPNVPAAAAFAGACRIMKEEGRSEESRIASIRDRMEEILAAELPDLTVNGDHWNRLSHNLHVSLPDVPNDAVQARLRDRVAVATGSACNSGAQEPSHVLRAMRLSDELVDGALRISPGRFTTLDEAERSMEALICVVREIRLLEKGGVV